MRARKTTLTCARTPRRTYAVLVAFVVFIGVCIPCCSLKLNPVVNKSHKSGIFVEKSQFEQAFQNAWHFVEENWDDIDWSDPQLDVMDYSKLGGLKTALKRWNAVEQKFVHTIKGSNQKVGDSSIDGGGNN